MTQHAVVSKDQWTAARTELLRKEKEFTRKREELSALRRQLPWVKVTEKYVFDGPEGKVSLADLFQGRSQLIVYHFMLAPGWEAGCMGCSFVADHIDGALPHVLARDASIVAVSRATLPEINAFKKRMGWSFPWVSSNANTFNFDYHVSFKKDQLAKGPVTYNYETKPMKSEELPGASVFIKDKAGNIYHTYSTYARGLENLVGAYSYIDLLPKGRAEDTESPMSWVRHHDKYEHSAAACCCGSKAKT